MRRCSNLKIKSNHFVVLFSNRYLVLRLTHPAKTRPKTIGVTPQPGWQIFGQPNYLRTERLLSLPDFRLMRPGQNLMKLAEHFLPRCQFQNHPSVSRPN